MKHPALVSTALQRRSALAALALTAAGALVWRSAAQAAEAAVLTPVPAVDPPVAAGGGTETAVLAGGCFWGVQGVFQHVKGVRSAVSGYAGGDEPSAHYEAVGRGQTGHAEAVRVIYEPGEINYARLLQIFFSVAHDPTQLNRQGPDVGTHYRSTLFVRNLEQARIAQAYLAQLTQAKTFGSKPVVTTIELAKRFFPAEAYHQDYMTRHPTNPYIVANDLPKVAHLQRLFADRYRAKPVLVGSAA